MKLSSRSALRRSRDLSLFESLEPRLLLSAAAFYVSPNGSDYGPGTFDSPWQSIQHGVDEVTAGNTLYIMQGNYQESVTCHASGTSAAPITISAYGSDAVSIWSKDAASPVFDLGSEDYITIQKLDLEGSAQGKIVGQGGNDGLVLKNLYLSGGDYGIVLGATDGVNDSHNIVIDTVHIDVSTGDGISFIAGHADGLTIRNVQLYNGSTPVAGTGTGINASGQDITIQNALISGWSTWGIEIQADNVHIQRNTVIDNGGGVHLVGSNMTVDNTLMVGNFHQALSIAGSGPFILQQNLMGFSTGSGAVQFGSTTQAIQVKATGNIFASQADYPLLWISSNADLTGTDYNLYFDSTHPSAVIQWEGHADYSSAQIGAGKAWATDSGVDGHSIYADPMLTQDYHLQAISPAIDLSPSGPIVDRDNKLRPSGIGYDLGPYEFQGMPDQVPPVVYSAVIRNVTIATGTYYEFTVTYKDNYAVSVGSLDSSDILVTGPGGFSQMAQFVSVNVSTDGKVRTAKYRITPPDGSWDHTDDGEYTISLQANQVSDPRGNYAAAGTIGVFHVNAFNAIGRFGDVDGRSAKLILTDADGTLVTFSLSGSGTGVITPAAGGGWDLNLVNTDARTSVGISTRRTATPGDDGKAMLVNINCLSAIKSISAKTTDLGGDLTAASTLASLQMNDATGTQSTITVNGTGTSRLTLSIAMNLVADLSVEAPNMGIKAVKVIRWLDTDGTADEIRCQYLGSLSVTGNKKLAIAGDFEADVISTSTAVKQGIGKIGIAGWLKGSEIRSYCSIGSVTAGGMQDAVVFAGVKDSIANFSDLLAAGADAYSNLLAGVGGVAVKGMVAEPYSVINSSIAAWNVSSASLLNVKTDNSGNDFGLSAHWLKSYVRRTASVVDVKAVKQLGPMDVEGPIDDYSVKLF